MRIGNNVISGVIAAPQARSASGRPAASGPADTAGRADEAPAFVVSVDTGQTGAAAATSYGNRVSGAQAAARQMQSVPFTDDTIAAGFDTWQAGLARRGAGAEFEQRVAANRETYLSVVRQAAQSGGFSDPRAFLQGLDATQRAALQQVHALADPIDPASLSQEGALNLLLAPNQTRDIDGDGSTDVGIAKSLVFPPRDAPQGVKDAWEAATQGLDFGTRLTMELSMSMAPGAPRSAASGSGFDWRSFAKDLVATQEFNRRFQTSDVQREHGAKALAALNAFYDELTRRGA